MDRTQPLFAPNPLHSQPFSNGGNFGERWRPRGLHPWQEPTTVRRFLRELTPRTVPQLAAGEPFPARTKENQKMKKLSHLTMLLAAPLALTSFALTQQQAVQDKLVGIVRSATAQYLDDVNAATAAGY